MKSRTELPSPSESPACGRQVEMKQKRTDVTGQEVTPAVESREHLEHHCPAVAGGTACSATSTPNRGGRPDHAVQSTLQP